MYWRYLTLELTGAHGQSARSACPHECARVEQPVKSLGHGSPPQAAESHELCRRGHVFPQDSIRGEV